MTRLRPFVCAAALVACQGGSNRPSPSELTRPTATAEPRPYDGSVIDTGEPDAGPCGEAVPGAFCGQVFLRALDDPPNLYFVVDRSGSMGEHFEGSAFNKYQTARATIADLLRSIGHRIRYGAAVFPSQQRPESCDGGEQIFPTSPGDPAACALSGRNGPMLSDLSARLSGLVPQGATPMAPTLAGLFPTLTGLTGSTSVVLITDGAPNCNFDARCDVSGCTLNVEGFQVDDQACSDSYNCCDPANTGPSAGGYCIDADATEAAVAALFEAGIRTYVVGMPGAEAYATVLDRLAMAGGTAQGTVSAFFGVSDADALRQALYAIGTGVAIRCSIDLDEAPEDPTRVNVYFDGELVPADETDGWTWSNETRIEVRGQACDELRSGDVLEARAVFGCDTVVR